MRINIKSPTKAYLENFNEVEIELLKKQLSYVDESVVSLIKRHRGNTWFKRKNPEIWQERLDELELKKKDCLLKQDVGGYWIRSGIVPFLNKKYEIFNSIAYPEVKPLKWIKPLEYIPYEYQKQSVDSFFKNKHGHVSLATGLGKSLILLMIAKELGDCVVVTPSRSIFYELIDFFKEYLGDEIVGTYGDGKKDLKKPITIAVGKSLTMIKEHSEDFNFFQRKKGLLVDESHSWSADTLESVCHGALSEVPYRFFASATQVNNSGKTILLSSIIGKCLHEMSIRDGIEKQFLCPLQFTVINTYSPSTINILDPMENKREHFLRNKKIIELAAKIANAKWRSLNESTLILVEEINQIKMLTKLLEVPFGYAHSASKKEALEAGLEAVKVKDQVEKFNTGEYKVLIGTSCIQVGTNIYPTHNTINLAGGSSEIVTKQGTMGRSTRKLEKSKYKTFHKPKPYSMIYDFNVTGNGILESQLKKRIKYYEETGQVVKIV